MKVFSSYKDESDNPDTLESIEGQFLPSKINNTDPASWRSANVFKFQELTFDFSVNKIKPREIWSGNSDGSLN